MEPVVKCQRDPSVLGTVLVKQSHRRVGVLLRDGRADDLFNARHHVALQHLRGESHHHLRQRGPRRVDLDLGLPRPLPVFPVERPALPEEALDLLRGLLLEALHLLLRLLVRGLSMEAENALAEILQTLRQVLVVDVHHAERAMDPAPNVLLRNPVGAQYLKVDLRRVEHHGPVRVPDDRKEHPVAKVGPWVDLVTVQVRPEGREVPRFRGTPSHRQTGEGGLARGEAAARIELGVERHDRRTHRVQQKRHGLVRV